MARPRADLYGYTPSFEGAIATTAIFLVLLIIHTTLLLRTRAWFCAPLAIGALCEVTGFATRIYSHSHRYFSRTSAGPLTALVLQAVLILLAPVLFAATIYMFLGRIMRATGHASLSPIKASRLTKIFVWGDIVLLNIQSTGVSLFTNSKGKALLVTLGRDIVLVGLVAQILVFGLFVYVAVVWHRRVKRLGEESGSASASAEFNWERYMRMVYAVSGIITARNLFRVAEFAMGENGYLNMHEWPLFAFDAALMAVVLVICLFWYVGTIYERIRQRESLELRVNGELDAEQTTQDKGGIGQKVFFGLNAVFLGIPGLVMKIFKRK